MKECNSSGQTNIFGQEMVISWPDFSTDHDGTNMFWKSFDFTQNNLLKSDTFKAKISVFVQAYGPKFDPMDFFSTLIKMNKKVLENLKVLQNLGITFEAHHYL